jgi:hypothetical protein
LFVPVGAHAVAASSSIALSRKLCSIIQHLRSPLTSNGVRIQASISTRSTRYRPYTVLRNSTIYPREQAISTMDVWATDYSWPYVASFLQGTSICIACEYPCLLYLHCMWVSMFMSIKLLDIFIFPLVIAYKSFPICQERPHLPQVCTHILNQPPISFQTLHRYISHAPLHL